LQLQQFMWRLWGKCRTKFRYFRFCTLSQITEILLQSPISIQCYQSSCPCGWSQPWAASGCIHSRLILGSLKRSCTGSRYHFSICCCKHVIKIPAKREEEASYYHIICSQSVKKTRTARKTTSKGNHHANSKTISWPKLPWIKKKKQIIQLAMYHGQKVGRRLQLSWFYRVNMLSQD